MIRKQKITMFILSVFIITTVCSKENRDNPFGPGDLSDKYLWVHFANDSTQLYLEDFNKFDVTSLAKMSANEDEAIWLSAFVDTHLIFNVF